MTPTATATAARARWAMAAAGLDLNYLVRWNHLPNEGRLLVAVQARSATERDIQGYLRGAHLDRAGAAPPSGSVSGGAFTTHPITGRWVSTSGLGDAGMTGAEMAQVPGMAELAPLLRWAGLARAATVVFDLAGAGEWRATLNPPSGMWTLARRAEWADTVTPTLRPIADMLVDPPAGATDAELAAAWPARQLIRRMVRAGRRPERLLPPLMRDPVAADQRRLPVLGAELEEQIIRLMRAGTGPQ